MTTHAEYLKAYCAANIWYLGHFVFGIFYLNQGRVYSVRYKFCGIVKPQMLTYYHSHTTADVTVEVKIAPISSGVQIREEEKL